MKLKLNDKIEIHWLDTVSDSRWLDFEGATRRFKRTDCYTIGYFSKQDKDFVWVGHSIGKYEEATRDCTMIPQGCIKKIWKLEYKNARRKI